jgi:short-subunit dehydrogenase
MPDKTALITGGSAGIGFELAKQFAAHGHDLVLVARNTDQLEAAAGKIEGKYGVNVRTIVADLADADSPQRLFDSLSADGIDIHYLVNNAGFGLGGEFADTDIERELDMIQVNAASVVHLTKLFLPAMLKRKSGRIMNVASTAAFQPGPLHSIYYATKAFVLSFSEAIHEELRKTGVTVTALCPGPTRTNFFERAGTEKTRLFTQAVVADAEDVARFGYAAMMKGQSVAIPGIGNKLMVQAERVTPRAVVTRLARLVQQNR